MWVGASSCGIEADVDPIGKGTRKDKGQHRDRRGQDAVLLLLAWSPNMAIVLIDHQDSSSSNLARYLHYGSLTALPTPDSLHGFSTHKPPTPHSSRQPLSLQNLSLPATRSSITKQTRSRRNHPAGPVNFLSGGESLSSFLFSSM